MEEEKKTSFMDRLKDATQVVATKAKEGIDELQTKRELGLAYGDLGRATAELVDGGTVTHPDLIARVEKINELKKQLEAESTEQAGEASPAPPV
jgi:hypothetical protein